MVLLDTGTPGTSREIYNEDADDETRTPETVQFDFPKMKNDKYIMMQ